jgi:GNAT superfamily N-acetyltransferase
MNCVIVPVNADNVGEFLSFFDTRAFCDNPDWAGCYCVFNHFADGEAAWIARTAEQNRAEAETMIKDGCMQGYLASMDDHVVGWCNINDKRAYPHYASVGEDDGACVCAVTCFVIDPDYRRQGVARALLRRACADYAALGYDYIESYPAAGEGSCAAHYHGHPAMYESEGFYVHLRLEGRLCMRKPLMGGAV